MPLERCRQDIALTLLVAIGYIAFARVGQVFAIMPANITPVWIPSGLFLALALHLGPKIWLGVFLGAALGNVWAYFTFESLGASLAAIAAGLLNGVGDVICIVGMAQIILALTGTRYPITSLQQFSTLVLFGVFIGPFCSALFGVTGLVICGFLPASEFGYAFSTWLIGDGVGALLFAPLLLSWLRKPAFKQRHALPVMLGTMVFFALFTAVVFDALVIHHWWIIAGSMLVPVFFMLMVHYGQRAVFSVQVVVATVAVYATYRGSGPFSFGEANLQMLQLQLYVAVFSLVLYVIAVLARQQQVFKEVLLERKAELERLYRLDALTGLWNRYRIQEFLEHEVNRFNRERKPFAVTIIDLDDFKEVNDQFGHLCGDKVLIELSELVKKEIRKDDLFGRWGGEEFIIVSADPDQASAHTLADKVRLMIARHDFQIGRPITVSLGYTLAREGDTGLTILDRADHALYQAKSRSKNTVCYEA